MPAAPSVSRLRGHVAVITGASRGIGRDIALTLARHGCNIVVAAKSVTAQPNLPGTIYTVADEVRALGAEALPVQCDVRSDEDIHAMVAKTISRFGRVDYLICNSGALWWKNVDKTPMSRYDLVNSINSRATFSCVREVLPHMQQRGFGRIIVMSPPVDLSFLKGKVAYCISKFGMTMIAMGLARELHGTGIAINALWPATIIESFATKNFKIGDRAQWRKASILSDSILSMIQEPVEALTGQAVIDEDYLRSKGETDFSKYQCVPGVEPPKAWPPNIEELGMLPSSTKGVPPGISARL